jgi:hypothetical protein
LLGTSACITAATSCRSWAITGLLIIFVLLLAFYSLLLSITYRRLTRPEGVRLTQPKTPIETTTAEERARGESSFVIWQERCFGITRNGFLVLATFGYIVFSVGFAVAFIFVSRAGHA